MGFIKSENLLVNNSPSNQISTSVIIVGRNADIEKAAKDACTAMFSFICHHDIRPKAILVQQDIYHQFMEKYLFQISQLKIGSCEDKDIGIGPIDRKGEIDKYLEFLFDINPLKIKCGGKIDMNRRIVYPTVICDKLSKNSKYKKNIGGFISFVFSYIYDKDVSMYFNDNRENLCVALYGRNGYIRELANIGEIILSDKNDKYFYHPDDTFQCLFDLSSSNMHFFITSIFDKLFL